MDVRRLPFLRKVKRPKTHGHAATVQDDDDKDAGPAHDPDVLPHTYTVDDIVAPFPRAVALEDTDGASPEQCICCHPGCSKCYPP